MTKKSRNFAEKAEQCLREVLEKHESMFSNELLHSIYETLSMREKKEKETKTQPSNSRAQAVYSSRVSSRSAITSVR